MKQIKQIKFAVPVQRVMRAGGDLAYYHDTLTELAYIEIYYDGTDFIVLNKEANQKTYVAKTNVSQWQFKDEANTTPKSDNSGIDKTVSKKAKS